MSVFSESISCISRSADFAFVLENPGAFSDAVLVLLTARQATPSASRRLISSVARLALSAAHTTTSVLSAAAVPASGALSGLVNAWGPGAVRMLEAAPEQLHPAKTFQVNSAMLAAASPYLRAVVMQSAQLRWHLQQAVPGLSAVAARHRQRKLLAVVVAEQQLAAAELVVKFMFTRDIGLTGPEQALEVLLVAEQLQVAECAEICQHYLESSAMTWQVALTLLHLHHKHQQQQRQQEQQQQAAAAATAASVAGGVRKPGSVAGSGAAAAAAGAGGSSGRFASKEAAVAAVSPALPVPARSPYLQHLLARAQDFMLAHFEDLEAVLGSSAGRDKLLLLPYDALTAVLSHPRLRVASENTALLAAAGWLAANASQAETLLTGRQAAAGPGRGTPAGLSAAALAAAGLASGRGLQHAAAAQEQPDAIRGAASAGRADAGGAAAGGNYAGSWGSEATPRLSPGESSSSAADGPAAAAGDGEPQTPGSSAATPAPRGSASPSPGPSPKKTPRGSRVVIQIPAAASAGPSPLASPSMAESPPAAAASPTPAASPPRQQQQQEAGDAAPAAPVLPLQSAQQQQQEDAATGSVSLLLDLCGVLRLHQLSYSYLLHVLPRLPLFRDHPALVHQLQFNVLAYQAANPLRQARLASAAASAAAGGGSNTTAGSSGGSNPDSGAATVTTLDAALAAAAASSLAQQQAAAALLQFQRRPESALAALDFTFSFEPPRRPRAGSAASGGSGEPGGGSGSTVAGGGGTTVVQRLLGKRAAEPDSLVSDSHFYGGYAWSLVVADDGFVGLTWRVLLPGSGEEIPLKTPAAAARGLDGPAAAAAAGCVGSGLGLAGGVLGQAAPEVAVTFSISTVGASSAPLSRGQRSGSTSSLNGSSSALAALADAPNGRQGGAQQAAAVAGGSPVKGQASGAAQGPSGGTGSGGGGSKGPRQVAKSYSEAQFVPATFAWGFPSFPGSGGWAAATGADGRVTLRCCLRLRE